VSIVMLARTAEWFVETRSILVWALLLLYGEI